MLFFTRFSLSPSLRIRLLVLLILFSELRFVFDNDKVNRDEIIFFYWVKFFKQTNINDFTECVLSNLFINYR